MKPINKAVACFKTYKQMADEIGVSPGFIGQMARGERPVPPALCAKIAEACENKVTEFDLRPDVFRQRETIQCEAINERV